MKFTEYYIQNREGKSNCVIRTFCKLFNLSYEEVYENLLSIKNELKKDSYNDIEVFENYMNRHDFKPIDYGKGQKIKDLSLDNETYIVFCWNKKEYYHMIPIINNTIYDKNDECLELYVLNLYKKENK
jgi:hypothetical protein